MKNDTELFKDSVLGFAIKTAELKEQAQEVLFLDFANSSLIEEKLSIYSATVFGLDSYEMFD